MRFEFDPGKSRRNWERHGIDFEEAQELWAQPHVVIAAKTVAKEIRYTLVAAMDGDCWAAVFTMRGETVRLISCHRADRRLERIYEEQEQKKNDS
ncbi:MAG: BrnT family toxin [Elusimicrobiota bacterium]|nr:BrnT family toxin [Elusimicrobiota bacterium]